MALAEQLILFGFLGFGAALWWDAAQAMRETQAALSRSMQRIEYAEAALKEIHRETIALRRVQSKKAGLRQAEARLSEATNLLLTKKEVALA
ncbi:MAG: hypothetical protein QW343_00155 [Candidatus Norongarragalinales archaeon]